MRTLLEARSVVWRKRSDTEYVSQRQVRGQPRYTITQRAQWPRLVVTYYGRAKPTVLGYRRTLRDAMALAERHAGMQTESRAAVDRGSRTLVTEDYAPPSGWTVLRVPKSRRIYRTLRDQFHTTTGVLLFAVPKGKTAFDNFSVLVVPDSQVQAAKDSLSRGKLTKVRGGVTLQVPGAFGGDAAAFRKTLAFLRRHKFKDLDRRTRESVDEAVTRVTPAKAWALIKQHLPDLKAFKMTRKDYRQGLSVRKINPRAVGIEVAHAPTGDIPGLTAKLADLFQQAGYATRYPTGSPKGGAVLVAPKVSAESMDEATSKQRRAAAIEYVAALAHLHGGRLSLTVVTRLIRRVLSDAERTNRWSPAAAYIRDLGDDTPALESFRRAVLRAAQPRGERIDEAKAIPMDFETFAAQRGGHRANIGDAGAHRRSRRQSGKQWNRILKALDAKAAEVVKRRDQLRQEYDRLVQDGVLRPLTRKERLERTASGHPDNPSVQAARRLLVTRFGYPPDQWEAQEATTSATVGGFQSAPLGAVFHPPLPGGVLGRRLRQQQRKGARR